MYNQHNVAFNPYAMPPMLPQSTMDISHRLATLERICFEILSKVSHNAVSPVTYGSGPTVSSQVDTSSDTSAPRPLKKSHKVRITDPSEPQPKPSTDDDDNVSVTTSSEGGLTHSKLCKSCRNRTSSKWDTCSKCYRAELKLRNTVPCTTSSCDKRVSTSNKSGLCHVCWTEEHPKCDFCNNRMRRSESASSTCSDCHRRFKSWHKQTTSSGAWQRTIQNEMVGKLYSRPTNGKFVPDVDQEGAQSMWDDYLEYSEHVKADELKNYTAAANRRSNAKRQQEAASEAALQRFKSGLTVEILPSRVESEEDQREESALKGYKSDSDLLSKGPPQSSSKYGVLADDTTFVSGARASQHSLPGFCKLPSQTERMNTNVISRTLDVMSSFPVSDGRSHASGQLDPLFGSEQSSIPSLLPPCEKFEKSPSSAVLILPPPTVPAKAKLVVPDEFPMTDSPAMASFRQVCESKVEASGLSLDDTRDKTKVCTPGALLPGFAASIKSAERVATPKKHVSICAEPLKREEAVLAAYEELLIGKHPEANNASFLKGQVQSVVSESLYDLRRQQAITTAPFTSEDYRLKGSLVKPNPSIIKRLTCDEKCWVILSNKTGDEYQCTKLCHNSKGHVMQPGAKHCCTEHDEEFFDARGNNSAML